MSANYVQFLILGSGGEYVCLVNCTISSTFSTLDRMLASFEIAHVLLYLQTMPKSWYLDWVEKVCIFGELDYTLHLLHLGQNAGILWDCSCPNVSANYVRFPVKGLQTGTAKSWTCIDILILIGYIIEIFEFLWRVGISSAEELLIELNMHKILPNNICEDIGDCL